LAPPARHSVFAAATSSLSEAGALAPPAPFWRPTSAMTASSTSAASPTTASSTRYSLLMSLASLVAWMMVLPGGTPGPNGVLVRLVPTAKTTSALAMNSVYIFGRERVDAPSDNGWLSAIALLPGLVVATGAGINSASAASCSDASA